MNILPIYDPAESEDQMQEDMAEVLAQKKWRQEAADSWDVRVFKGTVIREFRIPEINRISDLVLFVTPRKIFNIECKLTNYTEVLKQAEDHLKWCDYSYICLHADCYIPSYIVQEMINQGIGLLFWRAGERPVEAIQAHHNSPSDKELRKLLNQRIKKKIMESRSVDAAKKHIQKKLY